jgi:hypothetical protein
VLNTDGYSVGTPGEPGVGLEGAGRLPQRNWVVKYSSDRVRVAVPPLQQIKIVKTVKQKHPGKYTISLPVAFRAVGAAVGGTDSRMYRPELLGGIHLLQQRAEHQVHRDRASFTCPETVYTVTSRLCVMA